MGRVAGRGGDGGRSSFAGDDEFFSHEVLNLSARTNVSYRILPVNGLKTQALSGLKAVLYAEQRSTRPELAAICSTLSERAAC